MKKKNLKTQDTNHNEYEKLNRSGGEKFFSIIMSVILLGIVVFYISLPIKALTYNDKSKPAKDENNSLVVDNGNETNKETESQEPTQEEKPVVDDEKESEIKPETEETTEPNEEDPKPETNDSTGSEQKYEKYAKITFDGLNVRTDTTSNSDSIGKAPLNAKLPVLEEYSEYTWVKVLFNGKEGYVHTDFVEYVTE